jgi:hypothetical protein
MHMQNGHTLKKHDDVPKDIREQLYAEEQQQSLKRHQKATRTSTASHPIAITNVLPAPFYQTSHLVSSPAGTPAPDMPPKYTLIDRLNIPGFRDDAVKEYCAWQQSQVNEPALKVEYETACNVIKALKEGLPSGLYCK